MRSFAKVQTDDRNMNQLQDNAGKVIDALAAVPLNSGILLSGINLVSGDNTVFTTLPTVLTGWFIVRMNAYQDIFDKQDSNTNPRTLILNSTGTTTVSVFVF